MAHTSTNYAKKRRKKEEGCEGFLSLSKARTDQNEIVIDVGTWTTFKVYNKVWCFEKYWNWVRSKFKARNYFQFLTESIL